MHKLLERQLKHAFGSLEDVPAGLASFLEAVDATYRESDSDRELLERSMDLTSQELLEMNRLRAQFLNNAAHELGTPLTPLVLQVQTIKVRFAPLMTEPERKSLEILDRSVQRLKSLAQDLLDAARLESNHLRLEGKRMDLAQVVRQSAESFGDLAKQSGVSLAINAPDPLPVNGDAARLGQVLDNLLTNALKFTPTGGQVLVQASARDGHAQVDVQDSGIGLGAQAIGRLFQPFSRVHDTVQVNKPGTGLGLYISKGILEASGGGITVQSAGLGKGTCFTVRLPLATGPAV